MSAPSTAREALIKELLGDMDVLLKRAEALPDLILDSESKIKNTVALIDAAGDRYRLAVTAFNGQAKKDLSEFADNQIYAIQQATAKSLEEHRTAVRLQNQQSSLIDVNRITEELTTSIKSKLNTSTLQTPNDAFRKIRDLSIVAGLLIMTCLMVYIAYKS